MTKEAAFAELYRSHYRRVRSLCRQILGSTPAAEDAAQEAFERAFRRFASYDEAQSFGAWIMTIARHHCLDVVRRRGLERAHFGSETEDVAAAETADDDALLTLIGAERAGALNLALAALPERYRIPLALAYFGDASYDDIATALGITRTHVGALVCRAKQALRKQLAEELAS
jgi:RNA polymerase sigma-70 factor (ECF subfamily)